MTLLSVQAIVLTGLAPVYAAAAAAGNEFVNLGREFIHVRNGGAAAITVTINSVAPCNFGFDHDPVISIPAGGDRMIGPFPKFRFDDVNGRVQMTYSAVASVTVAIIQLL
ncbi:MAG: hypothetical protein DDT41_01610 [candidate division WS2 bacterium]|nr:hypothetical protein [Candidatus Psychracetigena formicireducens]